MQNFSGMRYADKFCLVLVLAWKTFSAKQPYKYKALVEFFHSQVLSTIQQFQSVMGQCLVVNDKLETSLRDLSRTGDVQACKAARKAADTLLKDLAKELKPLLSFLQSSSQAAHILPKVCTLSNFPYESCLITLFESTQYYLQHALVSSLETPLQNLRFLYRTTYKTLLV